MVMVFLVSRGNFYSCLVSILCRKHVERKYQMGLETNGRDGANEAAVRATSDGDIVSCYF